MPISNTFRLSLRQKAILGIGFTYAAIIAVFAFSAVKNEQEIVKEEMMNTLYRKMEELAIPFDSQLRGGST
ncbi:MAG: hypothetical protein ACE5IR_20630 [bacterium]